MTEEDAALYEQDAAARTEADYIFDTQDDEEQDR